MRSLDLQDGWDDEESVEGGRRLGQDLVTIQRGPRYVLPKGVDQPQGMRRLDVGLPSQRLDTGCMLQDHTELCLVGLQLVVTELETGQTRHVGYVDLDGHGCIVSPDPPSSIGSEPRLEPYAGLMAEGNPLKGTAIALGAVGILMIGAGLAVALFADAGRQSTEGSLLIRAGALVGAVALVLPTIRKPSLPTVLVSLVGLALVMARPGLVWAALIGWSIWVIRRSQRRTSSKES